eukprot:520755-Prorocentrum_lima.AAC.1
MTSSLVGSEMCIRDRPRPSDASHKLYEAARTRPLESLARRAKVMAETLNMMEGVTCSAPDGSMYAFPNSQLSPAAEETCAASGDAC